MGEWIPMIVLKVPYSSPNNPFPHSLLRPSQMGAELRLGYRVYGMGP